MVEHRATVYRRRRRLFRIIFLLLFLLAVGLLFLPRNDSNLLGIDRSKVESTMSPILSVVSMPFRGLEAFLDEQKSRDEVYTENKRLKEELAQLRDMEARANALSVKLSRLEHIFNVDPGSGIPTERIAARAISETHGPFVRSFLINIGRNKGIEPGYAVMTTDGLLGHVIRVGDKASRVLRLEDLNSRIAVMSIRSQSRAIMTGDNSSYPRLSFIREDADWADGDLVITSGDDGILPAGLPIGYVRMSQERTFSVHLYSHENYVDWVWVYPHSPLILENIYVQDTENMEALKSDGEVDEDKPSSTNIKGGQEP